MIDFAPGMRTIIRDEEWMVKKIETNSLGNKTLYCVGISPIKALIIYPMNALATDQAKRIAELIYGSDELRGNVTVGMYVGGQEH